MHKILLVEDDHVIAKAYGAGLESAGFHVERAYDGVEGLKRAITFKPDLILLDLLLPELDGIGVMKKLKESPETSAIPIIVLSNLSTSEKVKEALDFGSMTFLVKSNHTLEDIVKKIKETLK
jgi:DNA-binding response OmpR family regulator